MSRLYTSVVRNLAIPQPGIQPWFEMYKVGAVQMSVALLDRTGQFQMPYNFAVYPGQEMPILPNGFAKTYEQCCQERAEFILKQSRDQGLPIYIMYSGGIDSTMVLISFMKAMSDQELKNNLVVMLTQDSINENPNFYYQHIRKRCKIMSSENFLGLFDKKQILVDGEFNDQIFGSDVVISHLLSRDPDYDWNKPWTRDHLIEIYRSMDLTDQNALDRWVDLYIESAKTAPCEVKSVFEFFWWINFNFRWQSVFFRSLVRADAAVRPLIDKDLVDNYYYHFFNSYDFQIWSMTNPDLKVGREWHTYKYHVKDLIYEYNKDAEYRDHKIKIGSLFKIFLAKNTVMAIDDQLQYLPWVDQMKYYNPNNFFV